MRRISYRILFFRESEEANVVVQVASARSFGSLRSLGPGAGCPLDKFRS